MLSISFSRRKRRFYVRRVIRSLLTIHLILSVIAFHRNMNAPLDRCAAVIVTGQSMMSEDVWASPLAQIGAYPYWSAYFYIRGMKTAWIYDSERTDLNTLLDVQQFQQIVWIGDVIPGHEAGMSLRMTVQV
jgi:hypothetical protein